MLKKVLVIGAGLTLSLVLFGCSGNTVESEIIDGKNSIFVQVEHTVLYNVVYDRETKVMYVVSDGGYNQGTFTMLVNADGTPKLYEEK